VTPLATGPSIRCPPGSFFQAFGAPRVDFPCFLVAPEPHRKIKFFRLLQKSIKTKNKSILGAPGLHFGSLFMTFGSHFGIDFSLFFLNDLKSRKVFVFQYFSMVLDHQEPLISNSRFIDF
jgi:hypothetical protein